MNFIERIVRGIDRFQQRHTAFAFVFGVIRKYGDDRGGSLAALIAYYGFLSLFPLLLILVTVLGIVAGNNPSIQHKVVNSAVDQFPIIGHQLADNIKALNRGSPIALVIGLLGLLWGVVGATQVSQRAMAEVWNVPEVRRPDFWSRLLRGLLLVLVLGLFVILTTALTGTSTFGGGAPTGVKLGFGILSALINVGIFLLAFRSITPSTVRFGQLVVGAAVGGVGWSALQALGGFLVGRYLRHASQVYGFFGLTLGTIWWLYLGAVLVVYAAELNAVLDKKLWPRSLVQPPLTDADKRVLEALAVQQERYPNQEVRVRFKRWSRHRDRAEASEGGEESPQPAGQSGAERASG